MKRRSILYLPRVVSLPSLLVFAVVVVSAQAGAAIDSSTIEFIYARLISKGIVFTILTKVKEIRGNTVVTVNKLTGAERRIEEVDAVVFGNLGKANDALYRSLKKQMKEIYLIGHALVPRRLVDSIMDGARVGRQI